MKGLEAQLFGLATKVVESNNVRVTDKALHFISCVYLFVMCCRIGAGHSEDESSFNNFFEGGILI